MRLRSLVLGILAVAGVTGIALAQDPTPEAIANRIDVMKVTISGAVRPAAMMTMGRQDYDAAAAKAAMETVAAAIATFPSLFPPGSEGVQDRAAPEVWTDVEGFKAASAKLEADAKAAAAAADQGLEAFKTAFAAVSANCKSCHDKYRLEE